MADERLLSRSKAVVPGRRLAGLSVGTAIAAAVVVASAACGEAPPPPAEPAPVAPASPAPSPAAASVGSAAPAAPPAPAPIDGALPTLDPPPLVVRHESTTKACKALAPLPPEVLAKLAPGAPVAVWEEALGEGACVTFPKDEGLDIAGVVVTGTVQLDFLSGSPAPHKPWMAFVLPGAGGALRTSGPARVVLIAAAVSGEALASRKPGAAWGKRRERPWFIDLQRTRDLAWGGGAYHARIGFDGIYQVTPAIALDTLVFSADAPVAEHVHDKQWECLVAFEGAGELVQKPAEGAVDARQLAPGAIVCIPPNRPHLWAPSGKSRLVALQIYAPPGPEQRFKKLASP